MPILLVQIFSLMLGAFLLGACLACLLRRSLSDTRDVPVAEAGLVRPARVAAAPAGAAAGRFGRALSGADGVSAPTALRTDQPVVEVQPPSDPDPLRSSDLADPETFEPAPASQAAPSPPAPLRRGGLPPPPALASEHGAALTSPVDLAAPSSAPPAQDHGQSYTQIAVGAAAAAAAIAAAKARAEAEAAETEAAERDAAERAAATIAAAKARAEAEAAERKAAEREAAERAAATIAVAKARAEAEAAERKAAEREAAEKAAAAIAAATARAEAETAEKEAAERAAAEKAAAAERAAETAAAEVARSASAPELAAPQEGVERPSRFGTPAATSLLERLAGEPVDDLTRIHGIDGALKQRLVRFGVRRFSQIAAWTPGDVWGTSRALALEDRVRRDNWIEQARILAEGGDPSRARVEKPPVALEIAPVDGDRLHRIIGIDPESEARLRANGVTRLAEIAAWRDEDVERFEALLGTNGRITRQGWVAQALFLSGGAPAAPEPATPDADSIVPEPPGEARESYGGLRSVRSEALRGDARPFVTSAGEVQDLKRIRGIGVLIEKRLNALGITAYEQVANWTRADIDRISEMLDFKGRIERENWIEQARILASGGQTEFSRRVDRGDA